MAYVNVTRAAQGGLADRFAAIVKTVKTAVSKRRKYAQTYRELNALTARELADLGIHASMIAQIAHEAAYGK